MEDEEVLVSTEDVRLAISGSIRMECTDCHVPIYVSPSGQRAIAERGIKRTICVACMYRTKPEDIKRVGAVSGAMEEVLDSIRHKRSEN